MITLPIERQTPEEYLCKDKFCLLYSHWLNPFGNWLEPLPTPAKRAEEAKQSKLPAWLYWTIRNPLTNFMHFWIGIVPLGPRGCWIRPESNGWVQEVNGNWSVWKKKNRIPLPYYRHDGKNWTYYVGWSSRGNFGLAFRNNSI